MMPLLLAAAAVLPIVAAGTDDSDGDGSETFADGTGRDGTAAAQEGGGLLEAALAAAGVAAVGVLLPSGRAGPVALWVSVVVPLWVVSLLAQRRAALRAPA